MPGCSLKPLKVCAWPAVLRRVHFLIPPGHVCLCRGTQAHALHLSIPFSLRCHASKADWPPSPSLEAALQPGLYLVSMYDSLLLIKHAHLSLPPTANAELPSDAGGHSHWESGGHHAEGSSCPEVGHQHALHLAKTPMLHVLTPGQTKLVAPAAWRLGWRLCTPDKCAHVSKSIATPLAALAPPQSSGMAPFSCLQSGLPDLGETCPVCAHPSCRFLQAGFPDLGRGHTADRPAARPPGHLHPNAQLPPPQRAWPPGAGGQSICPGLYHILNR